MKSFECDHMTTWLTMSIFSSYARVNVGLFCTTPGVAVGRSVPRKVALEMLFTGHPISAQGELSDTGVGFGTKGTRLAHNWVKSRQIAILFLVQVHLELRQTLLAKLC